MKPRFIKIFPRQTVAPYGIHSTIGNPFEIPAYETIYVPYTQTAFIHTDLYCIV